MASPPPPYKDFLGTWVLQPTACSYEQGAPPREGKYVIAEQDGRLVFTIDWMDAEGVRHHLSFAGTPDGRPAPFAGGALADALSIAAPSTRRLDSVAYKNGEALMFAERQLDETGQAMRVVQQVRLPDGTRPTNTSLYLRYLPG